MFLFFGLRWVPEAFGRPSEGPWGTLGGFPGSSGATGPRSPKTLTPICFARLVYAVALWEAFYIQNMRFDLDTLRVPSRSPNQISKFLADFGPGPA